MAIATISTDLLSFGANVTTTTGWSEPTGFTATDAAGEIDTDLFIYGTACYTEAQRKSGKGGLFYTTTEPAGWTTGDCIFVWHKFFASTGITTKAVGGIQLLIGNTNANFKHYYVNGSDTYAYGGWQNYVADPTVTGSQADTGTPSGVINGAGVGCDLLTGVSKGQSHNHDIYRWGRGELIVTGGTTPEFGRFIDMSEFNDHPTTGRFGLFQDVGGSYLWKGLISLGTAATSVDFRDSNVAISVADTEYVTSAFNKIEVNNASSNIDWVGVSITGLGTVSKGQFEAVANAPIDFIGCTFTDMDSFIFQSNSTITTTTFRRCGLVTTGGGSFTELIFDAPSSTGVLTSALSEITDSSFTKGASGHAVELDSIGAGTMTWENTTSGYDTGVTGSPVTPTTTGDEDIYVNVGTGTITINIATGATIPSIRSAGATVNVVAGQVDFTFTVNPAIISYEYRIYSVTALGSMVGATELQGLETATLSSYTYTYTYTAPIFIAVQIIAQPQNDYEEVINYYTLGETDQTQTINLTPDINN